MLDALKAATAFFHADTIVKERQKLREQLLKELKSRLAGQGIVVTDVSLTNFHFSAGFHQAIERKQVEEQRVLEAEFRRQQVVKNAEAAVAQAEGQAKANKLLAESLKQSPETIRFRELEVMEKKWDGKFPQTMLGGTSMIPMLNVGK